MTDSDGPLFVTQNKTKHDLMSAALNVGFVLAQTKCEVELSTSFCSSKEKRKNLHIPETTVSSIGFRGDFKREVNSHSENIYDFHFLPII